ncbi:MAG: leucine-rich repeat domain-containing protein [Tannerella sp.]|nr:leucine-rich repeat domain-containing protein [Tannerella sp.]
MNRMNVRKAVMRWTVVSMVYAMVALSAYGQEIGGEMTSEVKWRIEGETLYISGKGVVPTTMFGQQSPWYPYRSQFHAVVIEEGITEAGKYLFNGYKNITSLTVAGSVDVLGSYSFSGCSRLATVEVKSALPPGINIATFYRSKTKKAKLIVPKGCIAEYKDTSYWKKFGAVEESDQVATDAEDIEKKIDAPCTVRLYREPRFSGGSATLRVYLNGAEQEKLENGATIEMKTDRLKNRIDIKWLKSDLGYFRFDALPGGEIQINYSAATGSFKIMEE